MTILFNLTTDFEIAAMSYTLSTTCIVHVTPDRPMNKLFSSLALSLVPTRLPLAVLPARLVGGRWQGLAAQRPAGAPTAAARAEA